jgi:hypothetical protein
MSSVNFEDLQSLKEKRLLDIECLYVINIVVKEVYEKFNEAEKEAFLKIHNDVIAEMEDWSAEIMKFCTTMCNEMVLAPKQSEEKRG